MAHFIVDARIRSLYADFRFPCHRFFVKFHVPFRFYHCHNVVFPLQLYSKDILTFRSQYSLYPLHGYRTHTLYNKYNIIEFLPVIGFTLFWPLSRPLRYFRHPSNPNSFPFLVQQYSTIEQLSALETRTVQISNQPALHTQPPFIVDRTSIAFSTHHRLHSPPHACLLLLNCPTNPSQLYNC